MLLIVLILAILVFKCSLLSCLECTWCVVENSQYEQEFKDFLEVIYKAECFLQVRAYFVETKDFMNSSLKVHLGLACFLQYLLKIAVSQIDKRIINVHFPIFWTWPWFLQE